MKPHSCSGARSRTLGRGQQPKVKPCGQRKGYKVFGLLAYFTGRFFLSRVGRPPQRRRLHGLSHTGIAANHPTHSPESEWGGAKYHISAKTKTFFAQQAVWLQVFQVPTYSPDYNPLEKLWNKIKQEDTHLYYFPTFEALTN
jgi:hypothetical protein